MNFFNKNNRWEKTIFAIGCTTLAFFAAGCSDDDEEAVQEPVQTLEIAALADEDYIAGTEFSIVPGDRGASAYMYVRLSESPTESSTVSVDWSSGDADQVIYDVNLGHGSDAYTHSKSLTFTAENYSEWQYIVFVSRSDTDGIITTDSEYAVTVSDDSSVDPVSVTVKPIPHLIHVAEKSGDDYVATTDFQIVPGERGATGYMYVRLSSAPTADTTVSVDFDSGDADQVIYDITLGHGSDAFTHSKDLVFTTENYDTWQYIPFVSRDDTDAAKGESVYTVSIDGDESVSPYDVSVHPISDAVSGSTVSGTIVRSDFVTAGITDSLDDISFTLSWVKVGEGDSAQYYGEYSDDDTLNSTPGDPHGSDSEVGNEDRDDFNYPAFGFWHNEELTFIISKSIGTDRNTIEQNLVVLKASDEAFTTGSGYVTGTDASRATGSYPIRFSASAATAEAFELPALIEDPEYDITSANMQLSVYGGGGITNCA